MKKKNSNFKKNSMSSKDNRRNGKPRDNSSKSCDKDKVVVDIQEYSNDVAWYSKNQQLLFDAANIPYHYPVGSPISMNFCGTGNTTVKNYYTPGITVINWVPSIGISVDNNSAVNMAARNLYAFIRQANSGAKNYDSPDLMLYLLAMDSLHAYYSWMVRVYGTFQYTWVNQRYSPKQLVEAQGAYYDDIIGKLAQFRYYINSFAVRLSALAVPNDMYYFTRHRWMSNNIYMDEASTKAQFFIYVPEGLYKYDTDSQTHAGKLTFKRLMKMMTLDKIIAYGEELLNAVLGDEDINIMSGDILKAYGNNLLIMPRISDDYKVEPVYSSEVLEQIHNATAIPDKLVYHETLNANVKWDIEQEPNTGALLFNPLVTIDEMDVPEQTWGPYVHVPEFALLDSMYDLPSASDTMVATRLSVACDAFERSDGVAELTIHSAGSEIVTSMHVYVFSNNSITNDAEGKLIMFTWKTFDFFDYTADRQISTVDAPFHFYPAWDSGAFDRMPLKLTLFKFHPSEPTGTNFTPMIMGERNNLTLVDREDLKRMHDCALLSEFNVPAFGPGK